MGQQRDELDEYAATIAEYCRERLPRKTTARPGVIRDPEAARSGWHAMCADLGIGTLLVAEELGGAGATLVEATRVAQALGAELAPVPHLSCGVLAATLLGSLAAGSPDGPAASLLRRLVDGAVVTVAWATSDPGTPAPEPLLAFDSGVVSGAFRYAVDADLADVVVLIGEDGRQIAAVEREHLQITARPAFDLARGFADVTADRAPATVLAHGDPARAAFDEMLVAGRLAVAAESAGGARAALDTAVAYAQQRVQFGREIGSFQAIKHLLADAFVDAESALSVARLATDAYVAGEPDAEELVAVAAFYCADRYADVAATGIQVHGGIGFTVETAPHLYRRRAEANRHILGEPAQLRAAYVDVLSSKEVVA
ncbi:acyl-CoA dehydrogenase family protein [Cumulibacter manganitolerans]|uniref:acyl-CoA dehydrogenase family protein n=1 Tax=Cumulibacter manganitolerans TaxID=1884992 RepID=UPI001295E05A|nr:acyl-CoA dehydrogenase family protein [Cumulibacter manganitolerans]